MSFQTNPDDLVIKRVETVGRPLPHVRAKIVNEQRETVPLGTPGEILVSGYLLHKGYVCSWVVTSEIMRRDRYWDDEEQTAKSTVRDAEGTLWVCTGDEGILDEDGYLKGMVPVEFSYSLLIYRTYSSRQNQGTQSLVQTGAGVMTLCRTSSYAAERTCSPSRSRTSWRHIPQLARLQRWRCQIQFWARWWARGSCGKITHSTSRARTSVNSSRGV